MSSASQNTSQFDIISDFGVGILRGMVLTSSSTLFYGMFFALGWWSLALVQCKPLPK